MTDVSDTIQTLDESCKAALLAAEADEHDAYFPALGAASGMLHHLGLCETEGRTMWLTEKGLAVRERLLADAQPPH